MDGDDEPARSHNTLSDSYLIRPDFPSTTNPELAHYLKAVSPLYRAVSRAGFEAHSIRWGTACLMSGSVRRYPVVSSLLAAAYVDQSQAALGGPEFTEEWHRWQIGKRRSELDAGLGALGELLPFNQDETQRLRGANWSQAVRSPAGTDPQIARLLPRWEFWLGAAPEDALGPRQDSHSRARRKMTFQMADGIRETARHLMAEIESRVLSDR